MQKANIRRSAAAFSGNAMPNDFGSGHWAIKEKALGTECPNQMETKCSVRVSPHQGSTF